MKRFFYLLIVAAVVTGCVKERHFKNYSRTVDFEGKAWNSHIADNPSSFDFMTEDYMWEDKATTLTSRSKFTTSEWGSFYGGGCTVSNYGSGDLAAKGSYAYDLYVYNPSADDACTGCGAGGSDNFLVLYGNHETEISGDDDCCPEIYFRDGKPRWIKSCKINSTAYFVNIVENGNEFSPKLAEGDRVMVYATGIDIEGKETRTASFTLATYGSTVKEWTDWDLHGLGCVVRVRFDIFGGPINDYGMTTPKYFAIDDIEVEWSVLEEV